MRTRGSSAAGLLLVLLCLTTRPAITNAEIVRTSTETTSYQRQPTIQETTPINDTTDAQIYKFLDIHDPRKINNDILALVENEDVVPEKSNNESSLDQQVDQSEVITVNTEDSKDLENNEHASTIIEYEPQKINNKGKRRIVDSFNNNSDSVVSASDNSHLTSPDVTNIYYEVPRTAQSKKATLTPQYYARPTPQISQSPEIEPRPRAKDIEYTYPVSTPKPQKQRSSRTRSPLNPRTTPSTDPTKFENPPPYRSYSSESTEPLSKKQKYYTDTIVTTTPPTDVSYTTKATRRRKKSRKRIVDKSPPRQESPDTREATNNNNSNNYPSESNNPRSSISSESRRKSRRSGLLAKYNVAPRPFTSGRSSKGSQEVDLEKSIDESVIAGVTRGFNNRNVVPNAVRSSQVDTNSYSKVVDPARDSLLGLNRKSYEGMDSKESSTVQVNVNSNPLPTDGLKESFEPDYFKSGGNTPDPSYQDSNAFQESYYPQDKSLNGKLVSDELSSGTTSSLDEYRNIKSPVVTDHSVGPVASPVPNLYSNDRINNYAYYPPLLSTLAPEKNIDINSASNPGKVGSELVRRKKKRNQVVNSRGRKIHRRVSDGVAQARDGDGDAGAGAGAGEELKENREYEIHEKPDEGYKREHGDRQGHKYIQDDQSVSRNSGGDPVGYNEKEDKGYRRYASKYDDRKEEDAQSDGSHDNESHQSLKEGAADGNTGDTVGKGHGKGGGQENFEKGEGAEQEEEHHEADGEKKEEGYKSWHENEEANKGHHDKERHNNYYDEKDGKEKEQNEESGYHEEHLEDVKGAKQTEFGERGEHQKGYSTKGEHSVHKKDEFEKRTEFFDEFHEDADTEKDGYFYNEHEMSKGDNYKVGQHDEDDHEEKYGKEVKHEKGNRQNAHKGHNISEGDDSHYEREDKHGKKEDHHDGKKWSFKKGGDDGADEDKE